jgi:hypothetical protein
MITKARVFAKSEHAGTDLTGKWDETIFSASDVNAYQDASKILAFKIKLAAMSASFSMLNNNAIRLKILFINIRFFRSTLYFLQKTHV